MKIVKIIKPTLWITFRIADEKVHDKSYQDRYDAFMRVIDDVSDEKWSAPSSFILFATSKDIDFIAAECKKAIAPTHDVFLIRNLDKGTARICGKNEDTSVQTLVPYLKRV